MRALVKMAVIFATVFLFSSTGIAAQPTEDAIGRTANTSKEPDLIIERDFIEGPFGQVHIRSVEPRRVSDRPPLILFHPTPYSGDYFTAFMKEMAKDRKVIAIDTPGYGDSQRASTLLSIHDYAASAATVLDKLEHSDDRKFVVDVLGYHTGGLIATELAVMRPNQVRRIALPGLPFYVGEERKAAYARNAKHDIIAADGSHLLAKWKFSTGASSLGLSSQRGQEHFNDAMQCYPNCWEAYHAVFTYETEKRLTKVKQPVLLITNAGSLKVETEAAQNFISNSTLVHMPQITLGGFDLHTKDIAKIVRNFLDK